MLMFSSMTQGPTPMVLTQRATAASMSFTMNGFWNTTVLLRFVMSLPSVGKEPMPRARCGQVLWSGLAPAPVTAYGAHRSRPVDSVRTRPKFLCGAPIRDTNRKRLSRLLIAPLIAVAPAMAQRAEKSVFEPDVDLTRT